MKSISPEYRYTREVAHALLSGRLRLLAYAATGIWPFRKHHVIVQVSGTDGVYVDTFEVTSPDSARLADIAARSCAEGRETVEAIRCLLEAKSIADKLALKFIARHQLLRELLEIPSQQRPVVDAS